MHWNSQRLTRQVRSGRKALPTRVTFSLILYSFSSPVRRLFLLDWVLGAAYQVPSAGDEVRCLLKIKRQESGENCKRDEHDDKRHNGTPIQSVL
jgi:hypothetical protein